MRRVATCQLFKEIHRSAFALLSPAARPRPRASANGRDTLKHPPLDHLHPPLARPSFSRAERTPRPVGRSALGAGPPPRSLRLEPATPPSVSSLMPNFCRKTPRFSSISRLKRTKISGSRQAGHIFPTSTSIWLDSDESHARAAGAKIFSPFFSSIRNERPPPRSIRGSDRPPPRSRSVRG